MKYSHNLPMIFGGALLAVGMPALAALNFVMVSPFGESLLSSGVGSVLGIFIGWGYLGGAGFALVSGLLFTMHVIFLNKETTTVDKVLWALAMMSCLSLVAVPAYWWVYYLEPYFTDKMLEKTYSKLDTL